MPDRKKLDEIILRHEWLFQFGYILVQVPQQDFHQIDSRMSLE